MPRSGKFDNTYPQKLNQIGLILLEEFCGAKIHHKIKCNTCNFEFKATPLSKLQNYKKWNTGGCPQCTKQQKFKIGRNQKLEQLENRGIQVLSDFDGRYSLRDGNTPIRVQVKNIKCGHIFETDSKNLLSRNVNCPICNKAEKIKRLSANSKARQKEWQKTADIWQAYHHEVHALSKLNYRKHKSIINPLNLPRGLAGEEGAYHLDHIIPVRWCFEHTVPANICAHQTNLQMLHWSQNVQAKDNLKEGVEIPKIFLPYVNIK